MAENMEGPEIDYNAYLRALDEINDSWRIVKDPVTGRRVELAVVNQNYLNKDAVLFPSTHFSSLTQNIGNAVELAATAADKPHTAFIYVAYPGNGGSQGWWVGDRLHFATTGRLTRGNLPTNYQPLQSVAAMARAVEEHVTTPNHISADIAGGRIALALMASFDPNSIQDAFLNGIPGISRKANYTAASAIEDIEDRLTRRRRTEAKVGDVVPENNAEAKDHLPNIFKGLGHDAIWLYTYWRALPNFITNSQALSGHDNLNDLTNHAVFNDTLAALNRQSGLITMHFNPESAIHDVDDCRMFGNIVRAERALLNLKGSLEISIGESGGLDDHTLNPRGRMQAERKALRSITQFMLRLIHGGRSQPTDELSQLERAA